ncbi:hypothetical protein L2E82_44903 [Cichorium intybus]|uniref:Uncharacterized protein n=1 Tax=Cichorium intybus TaxID=13427 RepID=A0ACB8ZRE1_CICIN|nr:hypothetical protein L2E82_44903 [Cichorium intybus]
MIDGSNGGNGGSKKRHRVGSNDRISSTAVLIDSSRPDGTGTPTEGSHKPLQTSSIRRSNSRHSFLPLDIYLDQSSPFDSDDSEMVAAIDSTSEFEIYLHSSTLR